MRAPAATRYHNAVLTVIAALLALLALQRSIGLPDGPAALAAPPEKPTTKPPFNAASQRRQIFEEIKKTNERIGKVEAVLRQGLDVRVVSMPVVEIKE